MCMGCAWPLQLERIHPFDSQKFGKVVHNLQAAGVLKASQVRRTLQRFLPIVAA